MTSTRVLARVPPGETAYSAAAWHLKTQVRAANGVLRQDRRFFADSYHDHTVYLLFDDYTAADVAATTTTLTDATVSPAEVRATAPDTDTPATAWLAPPATPAAPSQSRSNPDHAEDSGRAGRPHDGRTTPGYRLADGTFVIPTPSGAGLTTEAESVWTAATPTPPTQQAATGERATPVEPPTCVPAPTLPRVHSTPVTDTRAPPLPCVPAAPATGASGDREWRPLETTRELGAGQPMQPIGDAGVVVPVAPTSDETVVRRLVGFACMRGDGYLMLLAVAPALQRHGLGHALMEHLQRTYVPLTCHARTTNTTAVSFYEQHDFDVTHEIANYYRDGGDAYYLEYNPVDDDTVQSDTHAAATASQPMSPTGPAAGPDRRTVPSPGTDRTAVSGDESDSVVASVDVSGPPSGRQHSRSRSEEAAGERDCERERPPAAREEATMTVETTSAVTDVDDESSSDGDEADESAH